MRPVCRACIVLALALPFGCASYQPQPISAADSAAALESRRLDDPRLRRLIEAALGRKGAPEIGQPWDLAALTLAAIYYHPDLDVARAKLAAARAGVTTARQIPNPALALGLTYNSTVTTPSPWTIGSTLSVLIETFGRREYRTARAQALVGAAREDLATAGWQVRGRVRTALLNLLGGRAAASLRRAAARATGPIDGPSGTAFCRRRGLIARRRARANQPQPGPPGGARCETTKGRCTRAARHGHRCSRARARRRRAFAR